MTLTRWGRLSAIYLLGIATLLLMRSCVLTKVEPGSVGVRYNNVSGPLEEDLDPGFHFEIAGMQRVWRLPSRYLFLNYTGDNALSIRTKDNNTVVIDVSVPYRIVPGSAHEVMIAGNHLATGNGTYRFERFANETAISVLRERLAQLTSQDFYNTERRLAVAENTRQALNAQLAPLHLQASEVLIRAAYFREEYERQLAQIQLNEQQKLLDGAKKAVADQQQRLDNYEQQTAALAAAKQQDWARRIAVLERAYEVGFLELSEDQTPGAARRQMVALSEPGRAGLVAQAAELFEKAPEDIIDAHVLGIANIKAETTEYSKRVRAQANGVSARLWAEGEAMVARVNGEFESKLNALLGTPGGRAYVAYRAADNVKFNEALTFQSSDGVPSILRLRDFALKFMGR